MKITFRCHIYITLIALYLNNIVIEGLISTRYLLSYSSTEKRPRTFCCFRTDGATDRRKSMLLGSTKYSDKTKKSGESVLHFLISKGAKFFQNVVGKFKFKNTRSLFASTLLGLALFLSSISGVKASGYLHGSNLAPQQVQTKTIKKPKRSYSSSTKRDDKHHERPVKNQQAVPSSSPRSVDRDFDDDENVDKPILRFQHTFNPMPSNRMQLSNNFISSAAFIIFLSYLTLTLPVIRNKVRSAFGFWCITYEDIQLAYLLNDSEINDFNFRLNRISKQYHHSESCYPRPIYMTEEVCIVCLSFLNSLIYAKIDATKSEDTKKNKDNILRLLRTRSTVERAKSVSGTPQSNSGSKIVSRGTTGDTSSSTSTSTPSSNLGYHMELRQSPSYFVITLLMASVGPYLSYKKTYMLLLDWLSLILRRRPTGLRRETIRRLISGIPAHIKYLSDMKEEALRGTMDPELAGAGFEVDVIWTPHTVSSDGVGDGWYCACV